MKKKKVLVVDDELPLAMMMVALLTRAGFVVEAACNAEKALHKAEIQDFDLITLDVDMPGGNGFHLFEKLKQNPRAQETPVVFVSGRSAPEDQKRALELGAVDFIGKPFNGQDFLSRVLACIKSPAQHKPRLSDVSDERADADAQSLCNAPQRNQ